MQLAHRLSRRTPFFYGWIVLFSAGSSQFVRNAAASLTLAVFVYPISEDLGWSRTLIAGAASVGGLAASGAAPIVGWIVDKYGARIVLSASVLVLGISTMSLAWATAPVAFYVAYGVGRVLFNTTIQIASSVVVSRWFIRMRGRASGLLGMSHAIGMTLFPFVASLVILYRDYQTAWIVLGLAAWIIALLPVSLLIAETPEDVGLRPDGDSDDPETEAGDTVAPEEPAWTPRQAIRTPALWILALGIGFLFVIHSGVNIHLVAYLRDQGLGEAESAAAISVTAILTAVGSLAWGWIVERLPARYALAGVALVMAVASPAFITADTVAEAYAYAGLFGFALSGLLVVPPVAYADYFGRRSLGTIRGISEPFMSLGQAIGAVTSGLIYDATDSYTIAFWTFSVIAVVTAIAVASARQPVQKAVTE
ncbi:MAG: MFS transporter [SAR202 cluster bacterium]|nr:MFS transporter [SAR202 cluster bacterium]